jgi:hypothetical protein
VTMTRRRVCDQKSPAAALIPKLENRGVQVVVVNASEYAQACGALFDMVDQAPSVTLGSPN